MSSRERDLQSTSLQYTRTSTSTFAVQVLPNLQKSSGRLLREVCHPYTALLRSNANFFLQTQENNQDEERETGCFQSKINYVNTKTRAKTKKPDLWRAKLVLVFVSALGSKVRKFSIDS